MIAGKIPTRSQTRSTLTWVGLAIKIEIHYLHSMPLHPHYILPISSWYLRWAPYSINTMQLVDLLRGGFCTRSIAVARARRTGTGFTILFEVAAPGSYSCRWWLLLWIILNYYSILSIIYTVYILLPGLGIKSESRSWGTHQVTPAAFKTWHVIPLY